MKQTILFVFLVLVLSMSSCFRVKNYDCNCTYTYNGIDSVPPSQYQFFESQRVKGRFYEQAEMNCHALESKYFTQSYSGSCLVQ